jgi:hypothetical protein
MSGTAECARCRIFAPFYGSVPLKMHQIFMLAVAKLRCVKTGGSGARCFAASPIGLPGVSSELLVGGLKRKAPGRKLNRRFPCALCPVLVFSSFKTHLLCWWYSLALLVN